MTAAANIVPRNASPRDMVRAIALAFTGVPSRLADVPYNAAGPSRSRSDWTTSSLGPNAIAKWSRQTLIARSRDLQRNDPHAARVITIKVNNIVGTGILATAVSDGSPDGERIAAQANALWKAVNRQGVLDHSGHLTGEAQQALEARAWKSDGESFVVRVWDPEARPIPMRTMVLESEMLDETMDGITTAAGNRIVQGIELSRTGRRVAYWFRTTHPGESTFAATYKSVRVLEEDVIHIMDPLRPGQMRGIPDLAPAMVTKKDLGDFEAFTLIAKKTEALLVGVVTRPPYDEWNQPPERDAGGDAEGEDPEVLVPGIVNSDGELTGTMRPGAWFAADHGTDIKFSSPQMAANYDTFKKSHLQAFAVATGCSYEQASGDFSGANYSTMRGGLLEFWRQIDREQWGYFIPAQQKKWDWVMEAGWLVGLVDAPAVEATWQPPKRQSIEPDKDVIADYLEVRAGWVDEDDKISERGYNPDALRKKIAATRAKRRALNIVSDADPEQYSWRGAFQPATPVAPGAPPAADGGA